MMTMPHWVKLPSAWIEDGGLTGFAWRGRGSENLAALMVLIVLAHHMDPETGIARLTYNQLCAMASLSREKIAQGLALLRVHGLIEREVAGRSTFKLVHALSATSPWAKLPARGLYHLGRVGFFGDFHLRSRAELDAVKLYLLFVARRSRESNMAHITFDQIEARTGIQRSSIRSGLSLLTVNGLIHVDRFESRRHVDGVSQAYRLTHIDSYNHPGTSGRSDPAIREVSFDDDF